MLATVSGDGSVRLWELGDDENIHVLKGQKGKAKKKSIRVSGHWSTSKSVR